MYNPFSPFILISNKLMSQITKKKITFSLLLLQWTLPPFFVAYPVPLNPQGDQHLLQTVDHGGRATDKHQGVMCLHPLHLLLKIFTADPMT